MTIPVVMAAIGEPLKIANSLARPGANIAGLSALVAELEGKRIELLYQLYGRYSAMDNYANRVAAHTLRFATLNKDRHNFSRCRFALDRTRPIKLAPPSMQTIATQLPPPDPNNRYRNAIDRT